MCDTVHELYETEDHAMDYGIKMLSQLRPILQGFRKSAGLTQAAVAERLGITQQSYAQLEANPSAASVERLFRVMKVLGVDLLFSQKSSTAGDESTSAETEPQRRKSTAAIKKTRTATVKKKKENW